MAGASVVRESKPSEVAEARGPSRATLTARAETLEHGIEDMLVGANAAVSETVEAVTDLVGSSAQAVGGAAQDVARAMGTGAADTAEAMGRVLDLPRHVSRAPWLMMAGAIFVGVIAGILVGHARRRPAPR